MPTPIQANPARLTLTPAGPPPRAVWPSRAEQLALVRTSGEQRCADALERYTRAKHDAQTWQRQVEGLRSWPSEPNLLHPDLQASNRRRLEEGQERQQARQAQVDALYAAYRAEQTRTAEEVDVLGALEPPPRLVDLVGGARAFVALPELALPEPNGRGRRPSGPAAVRLSLMRHHAVMRGLDGADRLFVAIAFERTDAAFGAAGVVTLHQAEPHAASAWLILNPDRFVPQGNSATWRGNLAPVLPNMAGRQALVGGPDAQAMFQALKALVSTGACGAYRLRGAAPTADASGAASGPSEARAL